MITLPAALEAHLPALQIVVPLISAALCSLLRRESLAWMFAAAVSVVSFVIALLLLDQAMSATGPIVYEMGSWAPPWGIELRVDRLNAFVLVIVSAISAAVMWYAHGSVRAEIGGDQQPHYYTAYLLCLTGLLGVTITGDAFNLFVFLEVSSLSSYVLIALGAGHDRRALTSAFTYLVMGTIGATFYVIGIGLLYMVTGTLNMADLAVRLAPLAGNTTVLAGLGFILVGISLKLALFPLHLWLPNAYAYAPSAVTAFLASTATKVAVYVLLRFLFTIFGHDYLFDELSIGGFLLPLALVAMFIPSMVAIFQTNLKRMLAYSSVAQLGYMVLGIGFGSVNGISATIIHLFNHAVTKGGLFMALGAVLLRTGSVSLQNMAGLGRQMPLTMAAFVVGGLSLIGVPLTVGFISKWYLLLAALESGAWPIAFLILASSLLAVIYIWRVVEVAYFQPPPEGRVVQEAPLSYLIPTWLMIGATIYFGIDATLTLDVAIEAATYLVGEGG
jgi:multicomponent Na+:H+ antiporter subunit D